MMSGILIGRGDMLFQRLGGPGTEILVRQA